LIVRHRAKEIVELINDPERMRDERQKAAQNKNKYTGVAAESARYGGFGSTSSSSGGYGGSNTDSYRTSFIRY
jgi:epsin